MANLKVSDIRGFDVEDFSFANLFDGDDYTEQTTKFIVEYDDGTSDRFTGSGFKYDAQGVPTAGTVTTYGFYQGNSAIVSTSGFSILATTIAAAAQTLSTTDDLAIFIRALGGADVLTGGSKDDGLDAYAGNDSLTGGGGNDTLDGGTGVDTMKGGAGDDIYIVDNAQDVASEAGGGGVDTVQSSQSFTIGATIENLTLTGSADRTATGNASANRITGNAGDNVLDGRTGADTMTGGGGNDTYAVDNAGDRIVETGTGHDLVRSSISFTLAGLSIEDLTLTGTADRSATGNASANYLTGNSGDNLIDGGAGADTMQGGVGDDTYVVDSVDDRVIEAGAGHDLVRSSHSFSLAGQTIEDLTLTGSGATKATGNALANHLIGNSGANVLDGAAGADTLEGGAGNDTYVVDSLDDVVREAGGGTDLVQSSHSFSLAGQALENLTLTGSGATRATGNGYANALTGNSGANTLDGMTGADTLAGGAGKDTFVFDTALGSTNIDRVTDFSVADDTIRLGKSVFAGLASGTLSSAAFHIGAAAADASDRIIYDSATGKLFFDDDGTGGHAAKQFATITAHLALTNADFTVV